MNTKITENAKTAASISQRYRDAFADYTQNGNEITLMAAYDLARDALAAQLTLSDFSAIHHAALRNCDIKIAQMPTALDRAEDFFLEGVSVFDMAIQGYQSNVTLLRTEIAERRRIEEELRNATFELVRQRDKLDEQVRTRTEDLQRQANALEHANLQLSNANREQADFTYALSHDLKTPINTIDMFLHTLIEEFQDNLDEEALELIHMASETAERMRQLIDDVLRYSRIVEDEYLGETVDLENILVKILADSRATIREAKAIVQVAPLPKVCGSSFQLSMLFNNFLSNALRYRAPNRQARINISAKVDQDTGKVVISVTDNGIGMAPDRRDRIFQLFKRLHNFDEIKGSGVGLALCKRVADNHKTAIEVQSVVDGGSTFSIALPIIDTPS